MKLFHSKKGNVIVAVVVILLLPILVIVGFVMLGNYNKEHRAAEKKEAKP